MRITAVHVDGLGDKTLRLDLECGHIIRGNLPHLEPNDEYRCPTCDTTERRDLAQPATDDELAAAANQYRSYMEATGVTFPPEAQAMLVRAARIQDAWRLAFKRVLG